MKSRWPSWSYKLIYDFFLADMILANVIFCSLVTKIYLTKEKYNDYDFKIKIYFPPLQIVLLKVPVERTNSQCQNWKRSCPIVSQMPPNPKTKWRQNQIRSKQNKTKLVLLQCILFHIVIKYNLTSVIKTSRETGSKLLYTCQSSSLASNICNGKKENGNMILNCELFFRVK